MSGYFRKGQKGIEYFFFNFVEEMFKVDNIEFLTFVFQKEEIGIVPETRDKMYIKKNAPLLFTSCGALKKYV